MRLKKIILGAILSMITAPSFANQITHEVVNSNYRFGQGYYCETIKVINNSSQSSEWEVYFVHLEEGKPWFKAVYKPSDVGYIEKGGQNRGKGRVTNFGVEKKRQKCFRRPNSRLLSSSRRHQSRGQERKSESGSNLLHSEAKM